MKTPVPEMQSWLSTATDDERRRVAQEAGISFGYLWLIAGGHRKPSEDVAVRLHMATEGRVPAFAFFQKLAAISVSYRELMNTSASTSPSLDQTIRINSTRGQSVDSAVNPSSTQQAAL